MSKKKHPDPLAGLYPAPVLRQVQGADPSIRDMDTAIQPWTELVNSTIPGLFNTLNYLKGVIDGL